MFMTIAKKQGFIFSVIHYSFFALVLGLACCSKCYTMGVEATSIPVKTNQPYLQNGQFASVHEKQIADRIKSNRHIAYITNYEGHGVHFFFCEHGWMALVKQNLPADFSSNEIWLPVFLEPTVAMDLFLKETYDYQKKHIHIIFPISTKKKKGFVYVGNIGLKGGGQNGSSLYKLSDFSPLTDYIIWPDLNSSSISQAIAQVANACASSQNARHLWNFNIQRGPFGSNTNKCNLFVAEVLASIGIYATSSDESGLYMLRKRIPTASDWALARPSKFHRTSHPKPGSIVAEKYLCVNTTGHVGIVVGYEETVSVNGEELVKDDFGFRTDELSKSQWVDHYTGKVHLGHKENVVYLDHINADLQLYRRIPYGIRSQFLSATR